MSQRKMTAYYILAVLVAITQTNIFCIAQPPSNPDGENAAETSTVSESFLARDADKSGSLTEEELVAGGGQDATALKRDFKVFDANADGLLSEAEFLTIPSSTPEDSRSAIPDPVVLLSEARRSELESRWSEWDQDNDGSLNQDEFDAAKVPQNVRGLEVTEFSDWDLDKNANVSKDEIARIVDIAFGVRSPTGELLRSKTGQVVDWRMFRGMNPDANGKVLGKQYINGMGSVEEAEKWFAGINAAGDDRFTVTEFSKSRHHTDPVSMFLGMDVDLNGRLTQAELTAVPADWGPPAKIWLPGFDDNADGEYSLLEFMLVPHVNLVATWHSARDTNNDGHLTIDEFRFMPLPALGALSAEYFRRLDLDHDTELSLLEWPFITNNFEAKFTSLDVDTDGELSEAEFSAEGSLPIDRLTRDFKVFDADNNGHMTKTEFMSIPQWVPEDQRTVIPDPAVLLSASSLSELTMNWTDWDKDSDGVLDSDEFKSAAFTRKISGLEMTGFSDWDQDHDKKVSKEDIAFTLDIAFGVRAPTGESLRTKTGQVVDWRGFLGLQPNKNGQVSREAYIKSKGSLEKAIESFPQLQDESLKVFGVTEFIKSSHRVDSIQIFFDLDIDLSGSLSPAEMERLPAWGPLGKNWLQGFDDDGDGSYSLREFRLIPQINLLTTWHAARDTNNDGLLSIDEFRFMSAPALAALSAEYFRRLDLNHDTQLSLVEWPFITNNPEAKFTSLDVDTDGELSKAEFSAEGSLPIDRLTRDFKVFDADSNEDMTKTEFMSIPHWVSEDQRTTIPDPVVLLSEARNSALTEHWDDCDKNSDGFLDSDEFKTAAFTRKISGLEMTGFSDWDQDHDKKVSKEDIAFTLDIAFGVRAPTGESLRTKTGQVVDWRGFLGLQPNKNGQVSREAYIKMVGPSLKPETWFPTIHDAGNEMFGVTEFMTSIHKTDPISQFLSMDVDLNGLLSPAEMDAIPTGWGPPGKNWLPGFDDNSDGAYSLAEFRFIPQVNLLATWHSAHDADYDGKLSQPEFHFMPPPALAALSEEYFRRLDIDQNGSLSLNEFDFYIDTGKAAPEIAFHYRDRDHNSQLSLDELIVDLKPYADRPEIQAMIGIIEEAFLSADTDKDKLLSMSEFRTEDGQQIVRPTGRSGDGSSTSIKRNQEKSSGSLWIIVGLNVLLVVGVASYVLFKK